MHSHDQKPDWGSSTPVLSRRDALRVAALNAAVAAWGDGLTSTDDICRTADKFYTWLAPRPS